MRGTTCGMEIDWSHAYKKQSLVQWDPNLTKYQGIKNVFIMTGFLKLNAALLHSSFGLIVQLLSGFESLNNISRFSVCIHQSVDLFHIQLASCDRIYLLYGG